MELRFTLASSSDWPPDRNVTPIERKKKHVYYYPAGKRAQYGNKFLCFTPTCDSWGNGAAQGSDGGHGNLLAAELSGTRVSWCDHVGLQQCSLQVHMVV